MVEGVGTVLMCTSRLVYASPKERALQTIDCVIDQNRCAEEARFAVHRKVPAGVMETMTIGATGICQLYSVSTNQNC